MQVNFSRYFEGENVAGTENQTHNLLVSDHHELEHRAIITGSLCRVTMPRAGRHQPQGDHWLGAVAGSQLRQLSILIMCTSILVHGLLQQSNKP